MVYSAAMAPLALMVAIGFYAAIPCLAWSPIAAVITWYMARRKGLGGGRYALTGAASSIFMLLHWPILVATLLTGKVPVRTTRFCYILLYAVWLLGPIMFWGQYIAQVGWLQTLGFGGDLSREIDRSAPLLVFGGFALMIVAWLASVTMTWKTWEAIPRAMVGDVASHNYMLPFAGAWLSTVAVFGYLFLVPR